MGNSLGAGAPIWLAIPLALVLMFGIGMLIERLALRRMIGQPVIMAIMLTLGIEIMLRGLLPGMFGSAVKRLDIGIPQAPLFVGDFLINRATLVGDSVSLLVILLSLGFFNSRYGVVMRAVSDDQTASWSVGIRVERAIAIAWAWPPSRPHPRASFGVRTRASTGRFPCCSSKRLRSPYLAVSIPSSVC